MEKGIHPSLISSLIVFLSFEYILFPALLKSQWRKLFSFLKQRKQTYPNVWKWVCVGLHRVICRGWEGNRYLSLLNCSKDTFPDISASEPSLIVINMLSTKCIRIGSSVTSHYTLGWIFLTHTGFYWHNSIYYIAVTPDLHWHMWKKN